MPRYGTKRVQRRQAAGEIGLLEEWTIVFGDEPDAIMPARLEDRRMIWDRFGEAVVANFVACVPGHRPGLFYAFDERAPTLSEGDYQGLGELDKLREAGVVDGREAKRALERIHRDANLPPGERTAFNRMQWLYQR